MDIRVVLINAIPGVVTGTTAACEQDTIPKSMRSILLILSSSRPLTARSSQRPYRRALGGRSPETCPCLQLLIKSKTG
jgi:hypothetical protein